MAKRTNLLNYALTEQQREALRVYLTNAEISQTTISNKVGRSQRGISRILLGQGGLNQELATKIYKLLRTPQELEFLCNLQEHAVNFKQRDTGIQDSYTHLRDAYLSTIKTAFDNQPNERKLEILADLENLGKKYEAK